MSTILKYRIHELAKDFGVPSKVIMDILAKYGTIPKNHMQILTDDELNYLFDYLTQENQTADINAALMAQLKRREEKPAPKKTESQEAPSQPAAEQQPAAAPAAEKPAQAAAQKPAEKPREAQQPAAVKQQPQAPAAQKQSPRQGGSRQSRFENAAPMQQRQPKRDQKKAAAAPRPARSGCDPARTRGR